MKKSRFTEEQIIGFLKQADGRAVRRHEPDQQSGQGLACGVVHEAPLQAGAAEGAAPGFCC